MDLKEYVSGLPRGTSADFAAKVGIAPIYLAQLCAKQNGRQPSPGLSARIEQATGKRVMRWDLRADWAAIWPELVKAKGAPLKAAA